MDTVFINDLRIETIIGIYDWERKVRQTISLDLEMGADIRRAAETDAIEDTLNYKAVAKRLLAFVEDSEFQLVETLAEKIAAIVLNEFSVPWVRLTVHKPGAVRGSRDVGVIIERGERGRELMPQVYVSVGSNIDRQRNIAIALQALTELYGELQQSPVYESAAVGFDSAPFYNLVLGFSTQDSPQSIQDQLHAIENRCGRQRTATLSARTLDLDLLLYDDLVMKQGKLVLPREDISRYAFVLRPLAEIAGSARHPVTGVSYADMWAGFDDESQPLEAVDWPPAADSRGE